MGTRFRLSDEDRQRLGGPEWYEYAEGGKFMLSEAKALQDFTGWSIGDFEAAAQRGDMVAIGFVIWLCRRRTGIDEKFSELDFDLGGLQIESDTTAEDDAPGNRAARRAAAKSTPRKATTRKATAGPAGSRKK